MLLSKGHVTLALIASLSISFSTSRIVVVLPWVLRMTRRTTSTLSITLETTAMTDPFGQYTSSIGPSLTLSRCLKCNRLKLHRQSRSVPPLYLVCGPTRKCESQILSSLERSLQETTEPQPGRHRSGCERKATFSLSERSRSEW